jgi:hypothetical protein
LISLSGAVAVAINVSFFSYVKNKNACDLPRARFLTHTDPCVIQNFAVGRVNAGKTMNKNSKVFDIIVLAGMVVNIILAVFLILYYFDFL